MLNLGTNLLITKMLPKFEIIIQKTNKIIVHLLRYNGSGCLVNF